MSPDLSQVTVPLWTVAVTTHPSHFHQLGSSETYLNTPTSNKRLDFWEDWFMKAYAAATVDEHVAFFDHWLKGIDNGIMDEPPVRLEIRTGRGASYLLHEHEWPIARTEYVRWYLDASPSDGDGHAGCDNVLRLARKIPDFERSVAYSAQVDLTASRVPPPSRPPRPAAPVPRSSASRWSRTRCSPGTASWRCGWRPPARTWISTSHCGCLTPTFREVDFCGPALIPGINTEFYPLAKGWLKASHRKLDTERSTEFRPKHTHLRADYAPLRGGEIVPVEVEIIPNTGLIRQGHRLRVDIQPYTGVGHGMRHAYDPAYHDGAQNMIYTGPDHPSYVQLPIVPPSES